MAEKQAKETKTQSKKNILIGCGALVVIIILIAVGISTCLGGNSTDTSTPSYTPPSYPSVVYEITGSAIYASVTLNNGGGGTEQYSKVAIPWSYTEQSFADNFLYVSAQNQGDRGTVTVKIYVDGVLFKTSSSSGAYVIATASGRRP